MNSSAWLTAAALLLCGLRVPTQAVVVKEESASPSRLRLIPQSTDSIVADMEESLDGTRLITHDREFAPRLWDPKTFRLLAVLGGAKDPVLGVKFSPDGTRIVTVGTEEVRIWDAKRGTPLARYEAPEGEFFVEALFSPSNERLAVASSSTVRVLDAASAKPIAELKGLPTYIKALDWSSDSKQLATGSATMGVLWDYASDKKIRFATPKMDKIRSVDLNAAGTLALFSNEITGAFLFDTKTGSIIRSYPHVIGDRTEQYRLATGASFVLKDDSSVLHFEESGDIVLSDPTTGQEQKRLKGHTAPIDEIRVNRSKTRIGTHGDDEEVFLWDLVAGGKTPFALKDGDQPTAATFGSGPDDWYLGLRSGELRKYDIKTGGTASGTLGETNTLVRIRFLGQDRLLAISKNSTGSLNLDNLSESKILTLPPNPWNAYQHTPEIFSDSGRFNIAGNQGNMFFPPVQFVGYDLWSGDGLFESKSDLGQRAEFVPNSDLAMMTFRNGVTFCYDFGLKKELYGTQFPDPEPEFTGAISPDGTHAVHGPYTKDRTIVVWRLEDRENTAALEFGSKFSLRVLRFSPDGNVIAALTDEGLVWWESKTGNHLGQVDLPEDVEYQDITFTRDGSCLIGYSEGGYTRVSLKDQKSVIHQQRAETLAYDMDQMFSRDGKLSLEWGRNKVTVWDVEAKKEVQRLPLTDQVDGAIFSPDDQRILTVDRTDGVVIWDAKTFKRLGSIIQLRDGSWLVMDAEGRYDANDPNEVKGAYYVLEWDGGLEALDVNQFKGLYWDPGLLMKLLGKSKEALRPVPDLSALKLYPEASLKLEKQGNVTVALNERDNGGIGRVVVSVNGKEVANKANVGYFTVTSDEIRPYLLPENRLVAGRGNVVSVRVSNADGTLTSLPTDLDIGVPAGLRSPQVKLYALFVGAGDYVGTARDLTAPPKDAAALAEAIQKVSGGFLSNRVEITQLATEGSYKPPTRANVLGWFDEVAQKASSSDIVMVFFAGHGMDKLGSRTGYYFLTTEADPDALTEANLPSVSVSGEDLRQKLKSIAANKQVVVLDTCHSGAAAGSLVEGTERSVSGDYQRAWESIKEATGTWMLAGSAADQLSYESSNVDHGMLTYSLLEAIDKANSDGLRPGQAGELFVDIERWLSYAANRVESLKNEVGLKGVQRPEFKRSTGRGSFDIGVLNEKDRGGLGLKPPLPIVILGPFEFEQEDPANLEDPIRSAFSSSTLFKAWLDVSKHPNVYRVAGEYTVSGSQITVKVFLQRFDAGQKRSTLESFEVSGDKSRLPALASEIKSQAERRIAALEEARKAPK